MKNKDIEPKDSKGLRHGYQEWYFRGKITLRGVAKHGKEVGYEEFHTTKQTTFYIR